MDKKDFEILRDKIFEDIKEISRKKGEDYTKGDADALKNFKEGQIFGLSPKQVCGMFMKKHIDAIYNYIRTDGQSESEPIAERIKDAILYLCLLQGIITEEAREQVSKLN